MRRLNCVFLHPVRPIGSPGVYATAEPSTDGRYLLVEVIHRPYSYVVPMSRFPRRMEVWDLSGQVVRVLADRSLQEEVSTSFDAVPTGPRDLEWRADRPATVVWVEALDRGDPRVAATRRDEAWMLEAPFAGAPVSLTQVEWRVDAVAWSDRGQAIVTVSWNRTRRARTWLLEPGREPRLLFDRLSEDRYGDPGRFLTVATAGGTRVLQTSGNGQSAYLAGAGASPSRCANTACRIASSRSTGRRRPWRAAAPIGLRATPASHASWRVPSDRAACSLRRMIPR